MEDQQTYLTTAQAAHYSNVPAATLATLRSRGGGPPYIKLGSRVLYRKSDIDLWMEAGLRASTSAPKR
jgi:excisionase family DNA binding protein